MQLRNGKVIGNQEQDDRCTICMDINYRPITLIPCYHCFCEPCTRSVAQTYPESNPQCPLCRTHITDCNEDIDMGARLREMYPREYETRRSIEELSPNTYPLPKRSKWYQPQFLKKTLKNLARIVINNHENMKDIFINILLYHLIIVHFGLNSLTVLSSITLVGYLSETYELSRNGNLDSGLEIRIRFAETRFEIRIGSIFVRETLKLIIEVGIVVTRYYLRPQKFGFFTVIPSFIINESVRIWM